MKPVIRKIVAKPAGVIESDRAPMTRLAVVSGALDLEEDEANKSKSGSAQKQADKKNGLADKPGQAASSSESDLGKKTSEGAGTDAQGDPFAAVVPVLPQNESKNIQANDKTEARGLTTRMICRRRQRWGLESRWRKTPVRKRSRI